MAPKSKARQQPGNMRSRQQAKLNSQKAQKAPIQPAPRTGPRRQLPPSTQGGTRVGNSSQPWGSQQASGQRVDPVRVREVGRPQLPPGQTVPESRRLPGMQGPQQAARPQRPGTSRPPAMDRRAAATAKAAEAARGSSSTNVRIARPARQPMLRGAFGKTNAAALALGIANAVDDMRLTPQQRDEKYKVVNPDRGQNLLDKFQRGSLGKPNNAPKPGPASQGVRVSDPSRKMDYMSAPTGSPEYNKWRQAQLDANKARLKNVGNPPAARPSNTSTPSRGSSTPQRGGSPARVSNPAPKAAAKTPTKKPMEKAYGESGKDLYMASKKNNPLMQRTFGYQTGDAPDQKKKKS